MNDDNKYDDHDDDRFDDNRDQSKIEVQPSGTKEKIQFGATLGDRRHHIKPYEDKRPIFKCIGKLQSDYGDSRNGKSLVNAGTGTVFQVSAGHAYVITCAHNVIRRDDDLKEEMPKSVKFIRERTSKKTVAYDAEIIAKQNYSFAGNCTDDLAILRFVDKDKFFQKLFARNSKLIKLFCSDNIIDNGQFSIQYSVYGYPFPDDDNSIVTYGQLWGMSASSKNIYDHNDRVLEMYVRRNKRRTLFVYNAIDTEGGESGSAILISLNDGTYGIVGIHTSGDVKHNWGVALNEDKMQWIEDNKNNQPIGGNQPIANNQPRPALYRWADGLRELLAMGFKESQCKEALDQTNGNVQESIDLLLT